MAEKGRDKREIGRTRSGLRYGWTTGSCAAAAAKAAAEMLFGGEEIRQVGLMTPKGIGLLLDVEMTERRSSRVQCAVRKYSGDDPDVTDGLLIFARAEKISEEDAQKAAAGGAFCKRFKDGPYVILDGGDGVGRVTRRGLEQQEGQAAINQVPRRMILEEIEKVCRKYGCTGPIKVIISIPEGAAVAKKTFNPRLGIEGGLSVLGTSGIVEPMSEKALTDTIWLEMKMLKENGHDACYVVPGNYGSDFLRENLGLDPELSVKCSNYVGEAIDDGSLLGMKGLLLIGHIGKFVKLAAGIMNTHSRQADGRMEVLAAHAAMNGADRETVNEIMACLNTTEAVDLLKKKGLLRPVMGSVTERIAFHLRQRAGDGPETGAIVFSNEEGLLGQTENAGKLLAMIRSGRPEPEAGLKIRRQKTEDRRKMSGIFTGVGAGPGDPELMTLKAVKVIRACSVIALPVSDPTLEKPVYEAAGPRTEGLGKASGPDTGRYLAKCVAWQIAAGAVPEIGEKDRIWLPMPMIKDKEKLKAIHDRDAEALAELLDAGKDVAFLTLGDPTVYSTCMYVHKRLKRMGYETRIVPGIPSFCAAAARMDVPLAENRQEIHILPASYDIENSLELPGTKVLMKAGRKMADVKRLLHEKGLDAMMVENCGMEEERIYLSTGDIPEEAGYYSLLVVKEKNGRGGERA